MWYFLTESLLAFTTFRDEFDTPFVIMFGALLFLKCFHWLVSDRIEWVSGECLPQRFSVLNELSCRRWISCHILGPQFILLFDVLFFSVFSGLSTLLCWLLLSNPCSLMALAGSSSSVQRYMSNATYASYMFTSPLACIVCDLTRVSCQFDGQILHRYVGSEPSKNSGRRRRTVMGG
jgi:hypothetical protein